MEEHERTPAYENVYTWDQFDTFWRGAYWPGLKRKLIVFIET